MVAPWWLGMWAPELASQMEIWRFHLLAVKLGQLALPFCASVSASVRRISTGRAFGMCPNLGTAH